MKSKETKSDAIPKKSSPLLFSFKIILISSFVLCTAYFSFLVFNSPQGTRALFEFFNSINNQNSDINKKKFSTSNILNDLKMASSGNDESWKTATNIYGFSAKDIDGNDASMEKYKWGYRSYSLHV